MVSEDKTVQEVNVTEDSQGGTVRRETVRRSRPIDNRLVAKQIIWYVVSIIAALLLLRIILQLLGANQGNAFVDFIYGVSGFFAAPFFGMFSYHPSYGVSYFETSTLVAIIVYLLVGWGVSALFDIGRRDSEV